jgi:ergothioneine biosynthesis protein EgtB
VIRPWGEGTAASISIPTRSAVDNDPGAEIMESTLLQPEIEPVADDFADLRDRYRTVRQTSTSLCRPLVTEDYQVQAYPEASPPKWHLAHTTWFYEIFVLRPFVAGYRSFDPAFEVIFNSYYVSVGAAHPRDLRHALARPTVEEVLGYRAAIDEQVLELLEGCPAENRAAVAERVVLGLHHEQQHQELLLMDVKRNFDANPLHPVYREAPGATAGPAPALSWLPCPGGVREIGHDGPGFSFDNERPRHRVFLEPYRLGSRLVTNGEYLEFLEAGGYDEARLWLSDGWQTIHERGWRNPLYWKEIDGAWQEMTLSGCRPLRLDEPVCHVSYYEADAYARFRGARLPTEAELETASAGEPVRGNFLDSGLCHPRPAQGEEDRQWFGDLWEWTRSAYGAYPGYQAPEGALGEYNGKFMCNQQVLRGGSCATPHDHYRGTYRNFFYPHDRWAFTGIRLALDGV